MGFRQGKTSSMKIVIDARFWSESGLGRYIRNLINELQEIDRSNEYYVLLLKKDYDTVLYHSENLHKVLADFKWYGWQEQIELLKILKVLKPDLVHFPHFNAPIFYRGKFVVTIHDLIHQHFQTRNTSTLNLLLHAIKKIGYRKVFSYAVKNSSKIIVPSNFVKEQLQSEWWVKRDKIVVTPEGVDEGMIREVGKVGEKDFIKVADKFGLKKPYLFYIGNAQPHKNLPRLISVFNKLKEKYFNLSLILSGPNHYFWEKIKKESHPKGMIFTGFVSEEEMVALYKNAEVFVMPSLEEGFGIPILEAMACSCPVVSSNAGSLPEVGGDAVIYFDPKDEKDMEAKISQILDDEGLRKELIEKGKKRYKKFSWQKMARQTLEIYQKRL